MSTKIQPTALVVTTAKDGAKRFHRPTCKRVNDTATTVETMLEEGKVGGLAKATGATCCKPSAELVEAAQELAAEEFAARITAWQSDAPIETPEETETVVEADAEEQDDEALAEDAEEPQEAPEEDAPTSEPTEAPAEAEEPQEEPVAAVTITLAQTGMAKHYWKSFARLGGAWVIRALADVEAKFTASDVTLKGDEERVELARVVLSQSWAEGYERFNAWRKENAVYKDTAAAEKGSHWFKSQRAALELAWLEDFMRGVASTFAADEDIHPGATSEAYESGSEYASFAF